MYVYDKILEHSSNKYNQVASQYLLQKIESQHINNDKLLLECANALLHEFYNINPNVNININANIKLQEVIKLSSSDVSAIINFSVSRCNLLNTYRRMNWSLLIKNSNKMIKSWPKVQDFYLPGLSDVLIMLSHAYNSKGMYEDGIHAIRLAIQISHDGLTMLQKYREKKYPLELLFIGPMLTIHEAIVASYHCLAVQLRYVDGVDMAFSTDWHSRSINSCIKFNINVEIISIFNEIWHRHNAVNNHYHVMDVPSEIFVSIHQDDSVPDHHTFVNIDMKENDTNELREQIDVDSIHTSSGKGKRPHSATLQVEAESNIREDTLMRARPKSAASKLESKTPVEIKRLDILLEKEKQIPVNNSRITEDTSITTIRDAGSSNNNNNSSGITTSPIKPAEAQVQRKVEDITPKPKGILNMFRDVWRKTNSISQNQSEVLDNTRQDDINAVTHNPTEVFDSTRKDSGAQDQHTTVHFEKIESIDFRNNEDLRETVDVESVHTSSSSSSSKRPQSANLESSIRDELPIRPKSAASKLESSSTVFVENGSQVVQSVQKVEVLEAVGPHSQVVQSVQKVEVLEPVAATQVSASYKAKHPIMKRHVNRQRPGSSVTEHLPNNGIHYARKLKGMDLMQNSSMKALKILNDIALEETISKSMNSKPESDENDEIYELNRLLLTIRNEDKINVMPNKLDSAVNLSSSGISQSKRFAKQFRLKSHKDMHKSYERFMAKIGIYGKDRHGSTNEKLQIDQEVGVHTVSLDAFKAEELHSEVDNTNAADKDGSEEEQITGYVSADFRGIDIDNNEVNLGSDEVNVEVDATKEVHGEHKIHPMKDILSSWVHEQMDEIDCAIEILKLVIKISTKTDPNSFIDQQDVTLLSDSFEALKFVNDFQLSSDVKNALAMQNKIDSTHDELIEGCLKIINLIDALTLLLRCIHNKVLDKRTTGSELSNEIKKITNTEAGKIVLSIYDIGL